MRVGLGKQDSASFCLGLVRLVPSLPPWEWRPSHPVVPCLSNAPPVPSGICQSDSVRYGGHTAPPAQREPCASHKHPGRVLSRWVETQPDYPILKLAFTTPIYPTLSILFNSPTSQFSLL